jgi:hypothetical protein
LSYNIAHGCRCRCGRRGWRCCGRERRGVLHRGRVDDNIDDILLRLCRVAIRGRSLHVGRIRLPVLRLWLAIGRLAIGGLAMRRLAIGGLTVLGLLSIMGLLDIRLASGWSPVLGLGACNGHGDHLPVGIDNKPGGHSIEGGQTKLWP